MTTKRLGTCVDLPLSSDSLKEVVEKAKDFAFMNGVCMHSSQNYNRNEVRLAKFTLFPTSIPKQELAKAKEIQTLVNKLIHRVAYDHDFLVETLKTTVEADEFTSQIYNIYKIVHGEGFAQNLSLGLLRSDYMLNDENKIKQVEVNTIAASFGGLSSRVSKIHRYILEELNHPDEAKSLPENNSAVGLASGLVEAWKAYNNKESLILFVVEDPTYNIFDQRSLELPIREGNPEIRVIRRSFKYLTANASLGSHKELIVDNCEIAVVYYRTGYETSAYPSEKEWDVRLLIERSRAIKCPSIQYHLAGTKKIQQVLAQSRVLKRFLTEAEAGKLMGAFVGLYALDFDEPGEKAVELGISNPTYYVLKPQREGGGNNVYGNNVRTKLESMKNSRERTGWILMELIKTPQQKNYLVAPDNKLPVLQDFVSELGIYGIVLGDENDIRVNKQVGHLIRSKPLGENEGGIIQGAGALDTPYLI